MLHQQRHFPLRPVLLLRVFQSGLTLRNRAYYLRPGERFDGYRAAYRDYIDTLFALAGRSVGRSDCFGARLEMSSVVTARLTTSV